MHARGIKENILKRLEELDELLFLSGLHNKEQLRAVVVGGAALLLMGYIDHPPRILISSRYRAKRRNFLQSSI